MDSYQYQTFILYYFARGRFFLKNGKNNDKYSRIEYVLLHVAF